MNIKKMSKSIEFKLTLYFIFFVAVIFLVIWGNVIFFFNYYYADSKISTIYEISEVISNTDSDEIDKILETEAYANDVCIIKTNGEYITGEYNLRLEGCGLYNRTIYINKIITDYAESQEDSSYYEFINEEEEVNAALLAISYEDESIFIYTNLKDTRELTKVFQSQMFYITIISLLISIVVSFWISKKIVDPLLKITKKAKMLGSTEDIKFNKTGITEFDNLAETLNFAQGEIGKTYAFKRDLMANVSHDLKTPLTMIKAYAEMCRDISYKDKKKLDEHLNIIIDETNRLTLLVNDILDMSKLQDKKEIAHIEKFDLTEEINKLVRKYEIIKETEAYSFVVDMPSKVIVNADKSKINQVIYNLVNNAINYTGEDKLVYITIKKKGNGYYVEIRDTGKGIKEKDINIIWEKYYKTSKRHKRNIVSSGIGLSIVKEIFLLHDYEYGVKSSSSGTMFYFIIK